MREEFIKNLIKEVYGPRNGPEEIINENPANEYITGVLIPEPIHDSKNGLNITVPDEEAIKDNDIRSSEEDVLGENLTSLMPSELDPRLRTRSFGISFILESENPIVDICISWARYYSNNDKITEKWQRKPFYKILKKVVIANAEKIIYGNSEDDCIKLCIKKTQLTRNRFDVLITLVNCLKSSDNPLNANQMIFQPSIRINHYGNLPDLLQEEYNDKLEFIYRKRNIKALGHMCSAVWEDVDYLKNFGNELLWVDGVFFEKDDSSIKEFYFPHIRTEFVPMHPMPLPSFDIFENDANFEEKDMLNAETLSETWTNEDLTRELDPLVLNYEKWIKEQKQELKTINESKDIAQDIIENQETALKRIKQGLKILKNNENAKLAFCFANKSILLQHQWKKGYDNQFNWRGFQIAFFLMNIESIVNEKSKCRNFLDLLWISTGGGKTESYLAIMAFTIAYRRLSNENYGGTSIISRYTLRLLTIQQFGRTLSLITATEYLRVYNKDGIIGWRPKKCTIQKDWLYGSLRFSLGLWVGSAVTPNKLIMTDNKDTNAALGMLQDTSSNEYNNNPAQVTKCPVCGNWLSIPNDGVITKDEKLFIVIKPLNTPLERISSKLKNMKCIDEVHIFSENHNPNFKTLKLKFNRNITKDDLRDLAEKMEDYFEIASLSIFNPGYFGINKDEGRNNERYMDLEIFCTDPECELNNSFWTEGHPFEENEKLDKYYERVIETPFIKRSRIPIPAYMTDEQIYSKCPTVVIGTVDKIARLAYENRVSSIFGNVSVYNKYFGFLKNSNTFPKYVNKKNKRFLIKVDPFKAPDLIIQDELHLIDGPLGSLFGIYESIMSAIMHENGGNPKYIASSATIKNAESQSKLLFAKELFQFPPHGLEMNDNFFVKEGVLNDAWNEENEGRIYMGIYAPGRGPMTPQVRLWSQMMNTSLQHKNDDNILYYWTIVGYYNAIRELGGGLALYREDIVERLKQLSDYTHDSENIIELSSRMQTTKIPLELNKIESDGKRNKNEHPLFDAIFTTSMFGTGVDISHLSLMILNGQPKTTESYIQASGRIGRERGGLVVVFLKAGRPRDLNHYEMFPAYHYKLQTGVEPISVSPFSMGALEKATGAAIVSYLRNSNNLTFNWDEEPVPSLNDNAKEDFSKLKHNLIDRFKYVFEKESFDKNTEEILDYFETEFQKWETKSKIKNDEYYYADYARKKTKNVVLGQEIHEHNDSLKTIYKKVPNSLRDVEETTMFWV